MSDYSVGNLGERYCNLYHPTMVIEVISLYSPNKHKLIQNPKKINDYPIGREDNWTISYGWKLLPNQNKP